MFDTCHKHRTEFLVAEGCPKCLETHLAHQALVWQRHQAIMAGTHITDKGPFIHEVDVLKPNREHPFVKQLLGQS